MSHLTPDEIVDAVEDALAADRREHVSSCETCRASVDELARLLARTRDATIPEPSPLFWEHFSQRVRAAIEADTSLVARPVGEWLRWQVLAPLAALALLVATLMMWIPRELEDPGLRPSAAADREAPATAALGEATDEASWGVITDLVGPVSLDDAERAGLVPTSGAAERALSQLTAAERVELTRLLTLALERPES